MLLIRFLHEGSVRKRTKLRRTAIPCYVGAYRDGIEGVKIPYVFLPQGTTKLPPPSPIITAARHEGFPVEDTYVVRCVRRGVYLRLDTWHFRKYNKDRNMSFSLIVRPLDFI